MTDGSFKSMTPDPSGLPRSLKHFKYLDAMLGRGPLASVPCDTCGARIAAGDWPWCKGKPEDHVR